LADLDAVVIYHQKKEGQLSHCDQAQWSANREIETRLEQNSKLSTKGEGTYYIVRLPDTRKAEIMRKAFQVKRLSKFIRKPLQSG
jgi:hypothetical protein